jgi:hypothetical protein
MPAAKAGDEKVFKFVGAQKDGEGVEALLDIQYIMGVAPGIKTEFWEYQNMDFCLDLFTWTSALVSTEDIPIVHSVSYGWQVGQRLLVQIMRTAADFLLWLLLHLLFLWLSLHLLSVALTAPALCGSYCTCSPTDGIGRAISPRYSAR